MASKARNVPPSRHNVSTACTACRNSKLKCDGDEPICGRCTIRGKVCVYQVEEDKRRAPHKRAVDVVIRRIHQLEAFIIRNGLEPPLIPEHDRAAMDKFVPTVAAASSSASIPSPTTDSDTYTDPTEPSYGHMPPDAPHYAQVPVETRPQFQNLPRAATKHGIENDLCDDAHAFGAVDVAHSLGMLYANGAADATQECLPLDLINLPDDQLGLDLLDHGIFFIPPEPEGYNNSAGYQHRLDLAGNHALRNTDDAVNIGCVHS